MLTASVTRGLQRLVLDCLYLASFFEDITQCFGLPQSGDLSVGEMTRVVSFLAGSWYLQVAHSADVSRH